jgi:hypothetical protein
LIELLWADDDAVSNPGTLAQLVRSSSDDSLRSVNRRCGDHYRHGSSGERLFRRETTDNGGFLLFAAVSSATC